MAKMLRNEVSATSSAKLKGFIAPFEFLNNNGFHFKGKAIATFTLIARLAAPDEVLEVSQATKGLGKNMVRLKGALTRIAIKTLV